MAATAAALTLAGGAGAGVAAAASAGLPPSAAPAVARVVGDEGVVIALLKQYPVNPALEHRVIIK